MKHVLTLEPNPTIMHACIVSQEQVVSPLSVVGPNSLTQHAV